MLTDTDEAFEGAPSKPLLTNNVVLFLEFHRYTSGNVLLSFADRVAELEKTSHSSSLELRQLPRPVPHNSYGLDVNVSYV
jgi:hypothetical protein